MRLSLEEREGYLHIVGPHIDIPVVAPPLGFRTPPVEAHIGIGPLRHWISAASYEEAAEQLRICLEGWLQSKPEELMTQLSKLSVPIPVSDELVEDELEHHLNWLPEHLREALGDRFERLAQERVQELLLALVELSRAAASV